MKKSLGLYYFGEPWATSLRWSEVFLFKRLFFNWRYRYQLRRCQKETDPTALTLLLQWLVDELWEHYTPTDGLRVTLTSRYHRISALLEHMEEALVVVEEKGYIKKPFKGLAERRLRLDDYLTDEEERPIPLGVAIGEIKRLYPQLVGKIVVQGDDQKRYYLRQYQSISTEVLSLLSSLENIIMLRNADSKRG